jgi:hypothetical protein
LESGSINGALLTAMLQYIDDKQVFDHSMDLNPFLLRYGIHFELEFLEYINCKETKCKHWAAIRHYLLAGRGFNGTKMVVSKWNWQEKNRHWLQKK